MLHFWWLVTVRAFNFSLGSIGSVRGGIPFTLLFLLVGALLVLRCRGRAEFKEHLERNVLWFLLSATAAWLPFFIWGMLHEPYLM
jgi:hypothetical protein